MLKSSWLSRSRCRVDSDTKGKGRPRGGMYVLRPSLNLAIPFHPKISDYGVKVRWNGFFMLLNNEESRASVPRRRRLDSTTISGESQKINDTDR